MTGLGTAPALEPGARERPDPSARPPRVLLGSSAARSCAVKTSHTFDATVPRPAPPAGPVATPPLVQRARDTEARLLEALISAAPGLVVDLRLLTDDPEAAVAACVQAMTVGAQVVVGGLLPPDHRGQRVGRPDALVRGNDGPGGRPTYHPVEVKGHHVLLRPRRRPARVPADGAEPPRLAAPPPLRLRFAPLTAPWPPAPPPATADAVGFRLSSREGDLLQLAHYARMLEAAGFAPATPLGAVIGTDTGTAEAPLLAWVDLGEPAVRAASRSAPEGWRLRSVLERYDHEHALRLRVADVAARRTGAPDDPVPLVQPVVQDECARCSWWTYCRSTLDDDDVSLRIDKGALDVREVLALRRLGLGTVPSLADADLDTLLPTYLPLVPHRSGAEGRLRTAARRARMLRDAVAFDRETPGPIEVPAAEIEVDFDIESSADGRIYLWGFLVSDHASPGPPRYVHVDTFDDLDEQAETRLAQQALGWLRDLVEGPRSVRVYHYSGYEPQAIRALADRTADPVLTWAADYGEAEFVDLYDVVKAHVFGVNGLGLKLVATHAGFSWRDEDPGGLNSQAWFAEAVHDPDPQVRAAARTRVLEYNEDDVAATRVLRAWLRSPAPPG